MAELAQIHPLWALAGIAALLLFVAGLVGHAQRVLPWLSAETQAVRTWAMRGSLAVTAVATAVAAVLTAQCRAGNAADVCGHTEHLVSIPAPTEGLPPLDLTVRVDGLSSVFMLVVALCGFCIAVYSFGYLRRDDQRHKVSGSYALVLLATMLALVVDNLFWLFVALELLTIVSADLIRYRGRTGGSEQDSRNAARAYLLVSHIGLMCLVAGLLPIVVEHGTLDLDQLRSAGESPAPIFSFALVLVGLLMRCGATPFHFWVPLVHPQLPTNTHAIMSAVILKVPIYLMIRFFLEGVIGPVQWWWGAVLLAVAGLTALVTVFYALLSADLKVALAYHSVENVGIILAGIGLALVFSDSRFDGRPAVHSAASIALLASLYHVVNHALFKTLLFLGIGSIERHVGPPVLHRLGGLATRLRWTSIPFMIGAAAIAGLPPLNGFISEWLTVQSLFAGQGSYWADQPDEQVTLLLMIVLVISLIALAMAFAMTALAFAKITGEAILGKPRQQNSITREPWSMRSVLLLLAVTCILLGLQPWLLAPWLFSATEAVGFPRSDVFTATATRIAIRIPDAGMSRAGETSLAVYEASLPMLPLLLLVVLPLVLTILLRAWRWARRPVWVGGEAFTSAATQYDGSSLTALLWHRLSRTREEPDGSTAVQQSVEDEALPSPAAGRSAAMTPAPLPQEIPVSPTRSVVELWSLAANRLLARVVNGSHTLASRAQSGDVRTYLAYILGTVIVVLILLAVMP